MKRQKGELAHEHVVIVFVIMIFGSIMFGKWSDNQKKIACFEAAKTNHNLKCE